MKRALRSSPLVILVGVLVLLLRPGTTPKLQAQSGRVTLARYGVVDPTTLPKVEPGRRRGGRVPFRVPDPQAFQREKQEANADSHSVAAGEAAPINLPAPSLVTTPTGSSFIGMRFSEGFGAVPPDTQIAAGPNHLFEAVNISGRILDKNGAVLSDFDLLTFLGVDFFTDVLSDPVVIYDHLSSRWFVTAVTIESLFNQGDWRLAVSTTSNPMDPWILYIASLSGGFPDYPKLAVTADKLVLTGNIFTIFSETFVGTAFLVANKADLMSGSVTPASSEYFPSPQGLFTIQPADSLSSTSTLYMVSRGSGRRQTFVRVWAVNGVPRVSPVTATTQDLTISSLPTPPDAAQAGTPTLIETNDNRLLDAAFRGNSLWVAATSGCKPPGDKKTRSCARFIQIGTSPLAVLQDFNFGTAGTYYYYPAIATDVTNNLLTVFNRSSSTEYASVYASGRQTADPINTLQAPVLIKAGENSYQPFANRWGDYSGAGVDPVDGKVWVAGEYARIEGGSEWGTWIAKIQVN